MKYLQTSHQNTIHLCDKETQHFDIRTLMCVFVLLPFKLLLNPLGILNTVVDKTQLGDTPPCTVKFYINIVETLRPREQNM